MKKLIVLMIVAVLALGVSCASGIQEDLDQIDNLSPQWASPRLGQQGDRLPQSDRPNQSMMNRPNAVRQNWDPSQWDFEKVTVNGVLKLNDRFATVVDNETSYIVPRLNRLANLTGELKDGSAVYIEGFVFERNEMKFLHPNELSIDNIPIELPQFYAQTDRRNLPRNGEREFTRGMYNKENRPNWEPKESPRSNQGNRPNRDEFLNREDHPHRGKQQYRGN